MKAFIYEKYGPPETLRMAEVDRPAPNANEVLVRVLAVSVNPADWHSMRGKPLFSRATLGLLRPKHQILGVDIAGQVEAVGSGVTRFKPGDEVYANLLDHGYGGFAEYVSVPVGVMSLKPATLSFEEAAAVPMAAVTALQGLRHHGEIRPEQKVLINGATGGVGTFAVQIAKSYGAEVTGVTSTRNIDLVRSLGADHVVDYTTTDFVRSGRRYDLILDTVGNRSVPDLRRALAEGGKAAVTGFTSVAKLLGVSLRGGKDIAHGAGARHHQGSGAPFGADRGRQGAPADRPALSVRRHPRGDRLPGTRPRQGEGGRRGGVSHLPSPANPVPVGAHRSTHQPRPTLTALPWDLVEGTVECLLVAMSLLALLGLRYPQRMLPILLFEVTWKLLWLGIVAVPLWLNDQLDAATREQAAAILWVGIIIAVIPWRHVLARYLRAPGQPWRRSRKQTTSGTS